MAEASTGVVVIGRNEGERLRVCLLSLSAAQARVYVDSGSTDGSCSLARSLGFDVVELTTPPGFTAARARNAGIERLVRQHHGLTYVQMVDGDCEVRDGWLDVARAELETHPRRAAVFGRRRERRPTENAYHLACDDEWNVPRGEVSSCGGDVMFRLAALKEVAGYNHELIAGEEPDLCLRLRQRGWLIWSNGREMTAHDVAIHRFPQWWRRSMRAGFAFAALVTLHRAGADPAWRRLLRSAQAWAGVMLTALASVVVGIVSQYPSLVALSVALMAALALQLLRLAVRQKDRVGGFVPGLKWAFLIMAAKAAQTTGWAQYQLKRLSGAPTSIIEYKG